jgi:hypothetical protein
MLIGPNILSVEQNQDRFGYDDGVKQLLINTAIDLGWM